MDFEALKVIWDTQNAQPLYAIDQTALHKSVVRKSRATRRNLNLFEWTAILMFTGLAVASISETLLEQREWSQLLVGVICLMVAGYVGFNRAQRQRSELRFDQSLRGVLDRALLQVRGQIRGLKHMVWWGGVPYAIVITISYYFKHDGKPLWLWIASFTWPFVVWGLVAWEIRTKHQPRLRDFESLRDKLITAESAIGADSQS